MGNSRAGGTRPRAGGARTIMRLARQAARREPVHSDAALSNSARLRIWTDRADRKGPKLRCVSRVPDGANRRALGCPRDLPDPWLATVSRTIARRPGCHAFIQALACLCQKARSGRLG